MKFKSICLVCRGSKKVIDKINNLPRLCACCKGEGWIEVRSVQVRTTEVDHHNIPMKINGIQDKILEAVKQYQSKFFKTKDIRDIRSMKLSDVAKIVGVHVSTICIRTKGMKIDDIEVKQLFSANIGGMSNKMVMQMMRKMIHDEPHPYSDHELQRLLLEKGVKIGRRTVAKYRMKLGILCAYERK